MERTIDNIALCQVMITQEMSGEKNNIKKEMDKELLALLLVKFQLQRV